MADQKPSANSSLSISPKEKDVDIEIDRKSSLSSTRSSLSISSDSVDSDANSIQQVSSRASRYNADATEKLTPVVTRTSVVTGFSLAPNATSDPCFEIDFEEGDGANPREWTMARKAMITAFTSFSTLTIVMYSTSYSSGIPGIMISFDISNETIAVLGITTYLIGLAFGSIILAPLSEVYGRRPVYIIAMALYTLLIIPCALTPNLEGILITRFFGALAGSVMLANAPGTISDIVNEEYRALAFSAWSIGPMNGPVIGPLIGGFVYEYMGWRWTNWVVMIASGVSFCMMCLIGETYAPAILRTKAARKRKETGNDKWHSRYDEKKKFWPMLRENLTRPVSMAVNEPICVFWNIYIAVIYGILYLCFVAYPIVFSGLRGWSPGITGLSYSGLGIGGLITICSEPLIRRMINAHKMDQVTGKVPPESMVSIVCIAAICIPVGELIFAWTCTPNVHWIVPIIAGIPFGAGNCAVFIYASNYLVHSYGIYAASALAGNAVLRSIVGGCIPLAGPSLYRKLGPHWAGTFLGLLELSLVPIPVVFWRYGHKIRNKSALITRMREDQERLEGKKKRAADMEERVKRREERVAKKEAAKDRGKEKQFLEV
ncbi:MFS general substrate transporter [Lepidopterella palustris CBS 459.81]|uniref:MFS general substrate transporter n=1 Tax=Lepidopterella palustris CBS 459.81 TaxID=1314670 RepID=A0A8E2EFV7_9PEZI|nr:MFS general substrate transporter [Lepidopterella palustris CBS 459.81]